MSDYVDISKVINGDAEQEIDPGADPFSRPRLPEGQYIGRLDFIADKAEEYWAAGIGKVGKATEGQKWLWTKLKFTVGEGDYEGSTVRDNYVDTRVGEYAKNSRVGGICLAAGSPLTKPFTHQHAAQELQLLIQAGKALVKASVVWEASFSHKYDDGSYFRWDSERITGVKSPEWPKDENGNPISDFSKVLTDDQGEEHTVRAFIGPRITRYAPVAD